MVALPMIPEKKSRWQRLQARSCCICALAMLLTACAPVRPVSVGTQLTQQAREAELAKQPAWSFTGRVALSQGKTGGSGRIEWQQSGADFDIRLSAPITRESWHLHQHAGRVSLDGFGDGSLVGDNAEALLVQASGWRIPIDAMAAWVRGSRAPGASDVSFDNNGLPATIQQHDWTVEYRAWDKATPARPMKIYAKQGEASVRLAIDAWGTP